MDSVFGFVLFSAILALASVAVLAWAVVLPTHAEPLRGAAWALLIVAGCTLLSSLLFAPAIVGFGDVAVVVGPSLVAVAACYAAIRRTRMESH